MNTRTKNIDDSIEKYRNRSYSSLTKSEIREFRKAGILNGFGGARQSWIVRWMIGRLLHKFSIAVAFSHDFGYWKGTTPRAECDELFFQAMVQDMVRIYLVDRRKILLIWNLLLCLFAYYCIRIFGKKFYHEKPPKLRI